MKPKFFAKPEKFREWLKVHHKTESELWVGFHKKDSGKPSMTWPEAVEEALCFGWIDGVRRSYSASSYVNRFTPRRAGSNWSKINIAKAEELIRNRKMRAAGRTAFEARSEAKAGVYSFEREREPAFSASQQRAFKADRKAWEFFRAQPPWYRRAATWWVISAKREETRERRLAQLIRDSRAGRTIQPLTRRP
ncbi:MAG: YdeI/OmpD-associated family protein [Actinomycetota bacterium]